MDLNYHDVMEAYKNPISVKVFKGLSFIPRIFSWVAVFVVLFEVSQTAYALQTVAQKLQEVG
tara:strand:- start:1003 stop:1188 length:186 start_codon:yes stop_codon:yes gene_type:complete